MRAFLKAQVVLALAVALTSVSAAPGAAIDLKPKSALKAAAPEIKSLREKWAVLVGAGTYQDPAIAPVRFAGKNVSDLAQVLKDPQVGRYAADHILTLSGAKATRQAIDDALTGSWLVKKALPNDLVVIYLCGRTLPLPDGSDLYLVAYDTLASDAPQSGIKVAALLSDLKLRLQSKRILLILDTSPADSRLSSYPSVAEAARKGAVSVLSAGEPASDSYDFMPGQQSCFTHYLIEGMKPGAGLLPLPMVAQYVVESVQAEVKKAGKTQVPVFAPAADGQDLLTTALGVPVKSSQSPGKVAIGHPVDKLQINRPDLAQAKPKAPPPSDDDDDDDEPPASVDFGPFMAKMKQTIQSKWQIPKGFESRRVVVVFTIMRDGSIVEPAIVESSSVESVDKSALAALKAASPLDPLPLGAPKSVQIRYQFVWKVERN